MHNHSKPTTQFALDSSQQPTVEEQFEGQSLSAPSFGLTADQPTPPPNEGTDASGGGEGVDPPPFQLHAEETPNTPPVQPFQLKAKNETGLPDGLKSGVEELSGQNLDDVKVHFNSSEPADLQAHAFARGSDIHVAPGQEKHLPEEAWHSSQQKAGRVRANTEVNGQPVNDQENLESEAKNMGAKAMQLNSDPAQLAAKGFSPGASRGEAVVQRAGLGGEAMPLDWTDLAFLALAFYYGMRAFTNSFRRRHGRVLQVPNVANQARIVAEDQGERDDDPDKVKKDGKVDADREVNASKKEQEKAKKLEKNIKQDLDKYEKEKQEKGKEKEDPSKSDKGKEEDKSVKKDESEQKAKEKVGMVEEKDKGKKEEESAKKPLMEEERDDFGFTQEGGNYREGILVDGNWGGHLEAHAMANSYGIRTAIYFMRGTDLVRLAELGSGDGLDVGLSLFWTGNHYQVIEQAPGTASVANWAGGAFYDPPKDGNCLYVAMAYLKEVRENEDPAGNRAGLRDRFDGLNPMVMKIKMEGARQTAYDAIDPVLANIAANENLGGRKKESINPEDEQKALRIALLKSVIYELLPWKEWKIELKGKSFKFVNRKDAFDAAVVPNKLKDLVGDEKLNEKMSKKGDSSFTDKGKLSKSMLESLADAMIADPNYNDELRADLEKGSDSGKKKQVFKANKPSAPRYDELDDTLKGGDINKFKSELLDTYYPEGKNKAHMKHGSSKNANYSKRSQLKDFLNTVDSSKKSEVVEKMYDDFGVYLG